MTEHQEKDLSLYWPGEQVQKAEDIAAKKSDHTRFKNRKRESQVFPNWKTRENKGERSFLKTGRRKNEEDEAFTKMSR